VCVCVCVRESLVCCKKKILWSHYMIYLLIKWEYSKGEMVWILISTNH